MPDYRGEVSLLQYPPILHIIVQTRYKIYPAEKYSAASDLYYRTKKPFLIIHNQIMEKEYLKDGYTRSSHLLMHANNPNGFADVHLYRMRISKFGSEILSSGIIYISCALLAGRDIFSETESKKVRLLFPIGYLRYLIMKRVKENKKGKE